MKSICVLYVKIIKKFNYSAVFSTENINQSKYIKEMIWNILYSIVPCTLSHIVGNDSENRSKEETAGEYQRREDLRKRRQENIREEKI